MGTSLESFTFRISVDCSACNMSNPVNGFVAGVRCYHCGEYTQLDREWWTDAVEKEHFAEALGFEQGEGREVSSLGTGSYRLAYGRRVPRCQKCKQSDLDPANLWPLVPGGRCFCPACGHAIRLRPADELIHALNPSARFVVGEVAGEADAALQAKTQPVLFACMGCGGGLQVDGSSRSVACRYCNAPNYLPDGLWNQLHPVPKPVVFFLICDLDPDARFAMRWASEDARAQDAGRPDLTIEQYERLAADEESDVRERVAGNPMCPPHVLERLARDDHYQVRANVAGNPAAPHAALILLVEDSDSDVERAIAGRPSLPLDALVKLAQSSDYDKRRSAAKHPSCPLPVLHELAGDSDDDVKEAARQRLMELKAQGVDISEGKKGFFGKLFG